MAACHEYSANLIGSNQSLHNNVSGFPFVGGLDFISRHGPGYRHFTVEVIGVRGAEDMECLCRLERTQPHCASVYAQLSSCKRLKEPTGAGVSDEARR